MELLYSAYAVGLLGKALRRSVQYSFFGKWSSAVVSRVEDRSRAVAVVVCELLSEIL